ncbi:MAG: DoxX family protein [Candidatus Pseudobacter hemicellulosilyticus]|uniref:DoxX family protein n=1 Tax=Candidatus Pseudobacter hemicellulosilyticus TaxID=3121375 RepID=A0AAJ6BEW9_9BACT|nr:MAG: DoxX family protein [Pseudobacter sp.]
MKSTRIIYWITTIIIFLWMGLMPALTGHSEMAKEGIRHLGYPDYFGTVLVFFKVAGSLALVVPQVPYRLKEWAYAGLTFDIVWAMISHLAVDGAGLMAFSPLLVLAILLASYFSYHKLRKAKTAAPAFAS